MDPDVGSATEKDSGFTHTYKGCDQLFSCCNAYPNGLLAFVCVLTDMVPSLLSIKAYMSISVHNNIDCYTVTCIFFNTLKRHYTAIYLLFFCSHPSYLANRSAACFRLQRSLIQWPFACNCNRLLYCILFMICIDRFPSALCNVICLLRFTHPFPGAVPFQYMRSIFPAENRSLILSTWGIPVWKHV